jgi:hypothetical protein
MEEIHWYHIGRTNFKQLLPVFSLLLKKFPYFGLDFQYSSNNFLYQPTAAPASPAPHPKKLIEFFSTERIC